jgi:aflatoxin regulatory protein
MMSGVRHYGKTGQISLTVQEAISRNEQTIDSISSMLQCPCSKNSFLLAIMSLIVFKVLNWYAAVVHSAVTSNEMDLDDQSPTSSGSSHSFDYLMQHQQLPAVINGDSGSDSAESGRRSAQLVLGELHRVQRFLNQLSPRLQACGRRSRVGSAIENNIGSLLDDDVTSLALSFSPMVLDQLKQELHKRVRAVSLEIIEFLRQD